MLRYTLELTTVSPGGLESFFPSTVTVDAEHPVMAVNEALRKFMRCMPPGGGWGVRRWRIVALQSIPDRRAA